MRKYFEKIGSLSYCYLKSFLLKELNSFENVGFKYLKKHRVCQKIRILIIKSRLLNILSSKFRERKKPKIFRELEKFENLINFIIFPKVSISPLKISLFPFPPKILPLPTNPPGSSLPPFLNLPHFFVFLLFF